MRLKTLRTAVFYAAILFLFVCGYIYVFIGLTDRPDILPNVQLDSQLLQPIGGKVSQPLQPTGAKNTYRMEAVYEEIPFKNEPGGVWKQGFPISYTSTKPLEVFIVPHSHQDPGWLKTFDEYYTSNSRKSFHSTLSTLKSHPEARFIYAEISFFSRWYEELTADEKAEVKRLLHSGQWEIVTGGWVMTDEAVSHHYAIIDQLIEGHQWLLENLDYRPTRSWSIDPFGHSSTMAYLTHKMGMASMVVGRVHYEVKKYLAERKAFEFYWQQPWDTDGHSRIFTHMLSFFSYDVPHTCGPDPSICCQFDFLRLSMYKCPWRIRPQVITAYNVAERAALLADQYRKKATLYNDGTAVLIPLGDDFRYQSVAEWNAQLDNYNKLFGYWNAHPELGIKAKFANLSDYFTTVSRQVDAGANFPNLDGDFFTYADVNHDYWAGYFTSRPWQKALTRHLENELRSTDVLYTATRRRIELAQRSDVAELLNELDSLSKLTLRKARRQLGLFQHHDGVTGTELPHVAVDYSNRMLTALSLVRFMSSVCIANLLNETTTSLKLIQQAVAGIQSNGRLSDLQPVTSLEDDYVIENFPEPKPKALTLLKDEHSTSRTVYVFNPLARSRKVMVRLPRVQLNSHEEMSLLSAYQISNPSAAGQVATGLALGVQLTTGYLESGQKSSDNTIAVDIGPLLISPMTLQRIDLQIGAEQRKQIISPTLATDDQQRQSSGENEDIQLQGGGIMLTFSKRTGLLKTMYDSRLKMGVDVSIDFRVYGSRKSKSGAYLFVPNGQDHVFEINGNARIVVTRGNLLDELTVTTPMLVHTVRLYKERLHRLPYFEIENTVNLLDNGGEDTELVMRITTNLTDTTPTFYTDSNCYQFIKRQYLHKIPIQGNLYPFTCGAFIQHQSSGTRDPVVTRLNLFTSHSAGVTSTAPGELRVWLDRRSRSDDGRGLARPLTGKWTASSKFRVAIEQLPHIPPDAVPSLSLDAQHIQLDFATPLQRFSVDKQRFVRPQISLFSDDVEKYGRSIPCDYHVISLRTLHTGMSGSLLKDSKMPSGSAHVGLLLRRFPPLHQPLANSEDSGLQCVPSQTSKLGPADIFKSLKFSRALPTGLTLIPKPESSWLRDLHVDPMELQAYLLGGDSG